MVFSVVPAGSILPAQTLASGATLVVPGFSSVNFVFADGSSNQLQLRQPAQFSGSIFGFQPGDTIDLGNIAVGSLVYSPITGLLTLQNAGTTVGQLKLGSGVFAAGAANVVHGSAGSFTITTAANGDTLLGTTAAPISAAGRSGAWGTSATWVGGTPSAATGVVLGAANAPYVVSTGTVSAVAGSLLLSSAQATLSVGRNLTVGALPVVEAAGTILVGTGAWLMTSALVQTGPAASMQVASTGVVELGGTSAGPVASLDGTLSVNGGVIYAGPVQPVTGATGGTIAIGMAGGTQSALVSVAQGGHVSDAAVVIGAGTLSAGTLMVSGPGSSWTDAIDPTRAAGASGFAGIGVAREGPGQMPGPAALLSIANGATMTDAAYATIGAAAGGIGAVTVAANAEWQIGNGAASGALLVGGGGTGSLSVLNGGTVVIGAGATLLAGGTLMPVAYGLGIGTQTGGSGTVIAAGTASLLRTTGTILLGGGALGGGGQGALWVTSGAHVQAAGLQIAQGSFVTLDATGAVDIGASASFVAGAVKVDAGATLSGNGVIAAPLVLVAAPAAAGGAAVLDIRGPVSGTGTITIAGGAVEVDGAIAASETIAFAGPLGTLTLTGPGSTIGAPIIGLTVGDDLVLGGGAQILNVTTAGAHGVLVQTRTGTTVLSNVNFAPGTSGAFVWFKSPSTGLWTIEVASPAEDWTGAAGDTLLGDGANWRNDRTGAIGVPNSGASLNFSGAGGTISGSVAGLDASFGGTAPWVLNNVTLNLAGHPSGQGPPQALLAGAGMTLNASTIEAGGSIAIGAYGGVRMALANGSRIDAASLILASAMNQTASVTLAAGTRLVDSTFAAIGSIGGGTLTLNGGLVVTQGLASLGATAQGTGIATIAAGGTWIASGGVDIGFTGSGSLTVTGAGSQLAASNGVIIGAGVSGAGALSLTGAATATVAGGLVVGQAGTGTLTLSGGGSLASDTLLVGAQPGSTGQIAVGGGGSGLAAQTITDGVGGRAAIAIASGGLVTAVQGVTIGTGGTLAVQSGGSLVAAALTSAGQITGAGLVTAATLVNTGTITASGGTLAINASLLGTGTLAIARGAELYLAGGIAAGETIDFLPGSGTVVIGSPALFSGGTIVGFVPGDRILLAGTANVAESYNPTSGTLLLSTSGAAISLHVNGMHAAADFLGVTGPTPALSGMGHVSTPAGSTGSAKAIGNSGAGAAAMHLDGPAGLTLSGLLTGPVM